jgi:DNA-binding response OmpR family regulator
METILIVDDEPGLRLSLSYALRLENFNVEEAKDGKEALNVFAKTRPDLVVLDVKMPGMSGWEVCQAIRDQKSTVPIVFLSSKGDEVDRTQGYSLGKYHVHYVVKDVTYSPTVLAAQIRAILNKPSDTLLTHQDIKLDVDACKTYWEDKEIKLSPVELHILQTMLKNAHKVHSKGSLKLRFCEDTTIDSHVRNIRDKFKKINGGVDPIVAAKGYGYRLYSV